MNARDWNASTSETTHNHIEMAQALASELRLRAEQSDRDGELDLASMAQLRESGLAALSVPKAFGGAELSFKEIADVVGQVAQGDPSVALVLAMQLFHTQAVARSTTWPEQAKFNVLTKVVKQGALLNALRVEPELGSPVRGGVPASLARRSGKGWTLSGRKLYSTGAQALEWGIVWASTDDGRVGEFLVPMGSSGVRVEKTWNHAGLRASGSHDVIFEDVELTADCAVDIRLPNDWKGRDETLNAWLPILLATIYHGVATDAAQWWMDWIYQRRPSNLGASLATLPRFRSAVGEVQALLQSSELLLWAAKTQYEFGAGTANNEGRAPKVAGDLVKYTVTQNAKAVVLAAIELSGNHGLTRTNPLERHLRNVLCSSVHQPQNDLILEAAGGRALDLIAQAQR